MHQKHKQETLYSEKTQKYEDEILKDKQKEELEIFRKKQEVERTALKESQKEESLKHHNLILENISKIKELKRNLQAHVSPSSNTSEATIPLVARPSIIPECPACMEEMLPP